jgi:hypothetical protein
MKPHILQQREYLGATVTGTNPCSTGGHPNFQQKKRRLQMSKFRFTLNALAVLVFTLAFMSIAQAQATRTWVSGVGDDVNPCSRTAPCKTFAGAMSKTANLGEISVLDPGGFGTVNVTKSLTIDGSKGAGFGSILAAGTTGVIVNTAGVNVILRNLSINGASTTVGSGIRFIQGRSLTVEDCQIFGFTGTGVTNVGDGISVEMTTSGSNIVVRNTSITNCTKGIRLTTTVGNVVGNFENVHIDQPTTTASSAIELATGGIAVVRSSYITLYQTGIAVTGTGSAAIVLGTSIFNTTTAINAGSSTLKMSGSQLVNNGTGVALAGGTFRSGCDNFLDGNTNNVTGGGITNACVQ